MATYIKIASNTVGSGGVASVTFSSIPSTYTDLIIKASVRSLVSSASDGQFLYMYPNGSSANQTIRILYGASTVTGSFTDTAKIGYINPSDYTASVFSNTEIYISNYASASNKSISADSVNENNNPAQMSLSASLWSNSTAISSIQLGSVGGNLAQYSTFTLYGISNAQEMEMADTKIEVNCATGEVIETELTADEVAARTAEAAAYAAAEADREAEATAKAADKAALLAKLGITADEAALLLS